MKSIRLSLVVYFLVLLGAALGTVSVIVYRLTQNTLQVEEAARSDMLQIHYADLRRHEETKLDQALAEQVHRLSEETQFQQQFVFTWYRAVSVFGAASASLGNGLATPFWLAMGYGRGYPPFGLVPSTPPIVHIPESTLARLAEAPTEYWQINTSWKEALFSDSLGDLELPFEPERYSRLTSGTLFYDSPELEPGQRVRRVVLRTPVWRFAPGRRPPRLGPDAPVPTGPGKSSEPMAPGTREPAPRTGVRTGGDTPRVTTTTPGGTSSDQPPRGARNWIAYFSYASDTTERDEAIAALLRKRDRELEQLHAESADTLTALRNRLLTVSLVTFVLTVTGGLLLVRFSLSPLQRLTDAVSRISERDVRLQLDDRRLPEELQPIVKRLQQSLGLLQSALDREKQAAADISHELRTPLAALLTTTEVALRKPRSPEEYREVIQDCRSSCQQMSRLVERLLALSRLDAGVDRLRNQEVNAVELVEKCAGLVRPLAEARGLTLRIQRNGPVLATLDADKLCEVVNNLLSNAIDYNQPKGTVTVGIAQENGHLNLEVRDTGIGMGPEALEHIFERFYRADTAREAENMHTGLGLAIVKGYLDLMGGTISVQSAVGQGSTFRVQLPVRPHAATGSLRSDA